MSEENTDYDVCTCGHLEFEHHRSWIPGGHILVEECEYYGANELGGLRLDFNGKWVAHCFHYRKDSNPEPQFIECDLEALIAEFEVADPGIRQRIDELVEILKAQREDPDDEETQS